MKLVLIRHGEPRYDEVLERGYPHQGYDLGKLTELGEKQAQEVSLDPRLKGATLIVSSPYTRALQTAEIISRLTNFPLTVENDLHEWMPDLDFSGSSEIAFAYQDYMKHQGKNTPTKIINWESYQTIKKRTHKALIPYLNHEKIIVVCHGIVMTTFTSFDDEIEHCGIREVAVDYNLLKTSSK